MFLDPEGGSQKATLVVVLVVAVVVISSLKIPKAFLICSVHIHADIPHRLTVSDFPLIF